MTTQSERPALAGPTPFAIPHRGSRLIWPENTLVSFSNAYDVGFRWLETDLHLTADGVLVCLHDSTVDRTTDGTGPISGFTFDELATLDAGYRFEVTEHHPYRNDGVVIPSLEEIATRFPDCRLVVDLKQDGLAEPLWSLLQRLAISERVVVGSFSDRRLAEFRDVSHDSVATSAGPKSVARAFGRSLTGTPKLRADALQIPVRARGIPLVTPRSVRKYHQAGYQVHVWTVNRSAQMHRLLDMGVDAIITDRPEALKAVMIERGIWTGA